MIYVDSVFGINGILSDSENHTAQEPCNAEEEFVESYIDRISFCVFHDPNHSCFWARDS